MSKKIENRKEAIKFLGEMEKFNQQGLFYAAVIFACPFGYVEERHIFAHDNFEVLEWAEQMDKKYNGSYKASVDSGRKEEPYVIYVNGEARYYKGNWSFKDYWDDAIQVEV